MQSKQKQQQQRKKRIERNRLGALSPQDLSELRRLGEAERETREHSLPDLISAVLIHWPLAALLRHTKLLLVVLNRNRAPPPESALPVQLHALLYLRYPCEYYETLFGDHAPIVFEEYDATEERQVQRAMPFLAYYNAVYREAKRYQGEAEGRRHYVLLLRACFLVGLVHDARLRRFVFSRHDIHYQYLRTRPPLTESGRAFLAQCRPAVNDFLHQRCSIMELYEYSVAQWIEDYMLRRGGEHTIQTLSAVKIIEQTA